MTPSSIAEGLTEAQREFVLALIASRARQAVPSLPRARGTAYSVAERRVGQDIYAVLGRVMVQVVDGSMKQFWQFSVLGLRVRAHLEASREG